MTIFTELTPNQKTDVMLDTIESERAISRIITEQALDEWVERLLIDVDLLQYAAIVRAMLDALRKHHKPSQKQIELILDLGFANLKYNSV